MSLNRNGFTRQNFLKKNSEGFTLIELLIYSVLIVIMMSGSILTMYQVLDASDAVHRTVLIEEEANFILRKIEWALSGAKIIILPLASATGGTLSLDKYGTFPNPLTIDLASGKIRLKRGVGGGQVPLNSDNTTVTSLSFQHIAPAGGKPAGINTSFVLNGKTFTVLIYLKK